MNNHLSDLQLALIVLGGFGIGFAVGMILLVIGFLL